MLNGVGDETTMNLAKVILFHIIEGGWVFVSRMHS